MIQLKILVIHYVQKNFSQGKKNLTEKNLFFSKKFFIDVRHIIGYVMLLMSIVLYSGNMVA
jgi:hypothetical protein